MLSICGRQYLSAWNNYKFAIDHIVLDPKYRMKAKEIAKTEGLLDNKKKKDKTKTKVYICFSFTLLSCFYSSSGWVILSACSLSSNSSGQVVHTYGCLYHQQCQR